MSDRLPLLIEDGALKRGTVNDTISVGQLSYGGTVNYAYLIVSGSANSSLDGIYYRDGTSNSLYRLNNVAQQPYISRSSATNVTDPWGLYAYYYNKTTNALSVTQVGISRSQLGTYILTDYPDDYIDESTIYPSGLFTGGVAHVFGSPEKLSVVGEKQGTIISSNLGALASNNISCAKATINNFELIYRDVMFGSNAYQYVFFGPRATTNNTLTLVLYTNNKPTLAHPFRFMTESANYGLQTFQSILIGTQNTDVSSTNFDDTFIASDANRADLGCNVVETDNTKVGDTLYTDRINQSDVNTPSLMVAGIQHHYVNAVDPTVLGMQVNTPDTRPSWGQNGQVVFARDTRRLSARYNPSTPNYPEFPDWRILGDMYQEYMDAMDEYKSYYVRNRTSSLSVETINLTTNIGSNSFYQIVTKLRLADGSCYFPSLSGNASLWIDLDGVGHTVTGNALSANDCCLGVIDNEIYITPSSTNEIRTQSTSNWTPQVKNTIPTSNFTANQYRGSAVDDAGNVHFLPTAYEPEGIKYNPSSNTVTPYGTFYTQTINLSGGPGAVVNLGGILYQVPTGYIDGDWRLRKVDPSSNTVTDFSLFTQLNSHSCITCTLYKNKVYFFKQIDANYCQLWYYDTTNNTTAQAVTTTNYVMKLGSTGFLGPDGCFYFSQYGNNVYRVDLETYTSTLLISNINYYNNFALAADGYAYFVPYVYSGNITDFKRVKLFDVEIDPNFLCNRYLNTN